MRRENFLESVWLGGGEEKEKGETWVFFLRTHQKVFSTKWGEN